MPQGFKQFGSETLTASDVNDYLMRQATPAVANLAARDAIVAPHIGMMVLVQSNGNLYQYVSTGWRVLLPAETADQALTLQNAWTGSATARKVNGIVYLRGEILTGATGTAAFTLPGTYRPASRLAFCLPRSNTSSGASIVNATVQTTGVVEIHSLVGTIVAASPGYSLAAITFPAA